MSSQAVYWDKQIVVEDIEGVPFRMYMNRPRRIQQMFRFAQEWGARPFIVQGDRVVTFDTLRDASAHKANRLLDSGVRRGDRVMLLGWNSPDWVLNFWACARIGAVPVLANAWWSEDEIADAIRLLQPAVTLADAHGVRKLAPGCRTCAWEVHARPASGRDSESLAIDEEQGDENDPAAIIFTSGTAGRPKAVVLAHRSLLAQLQMLLHVTGRLPYSPNPYAGEVCLHTGPLFHIGGIHALLRGVTVGNTLIMPAGKFEAGEALQLIEHHRISRWNAVPTMAMRLLEHPDAQRRDLSSLRAMTLGGAAVHAELLERIRIGLPGMDLKIATGYGLSENAGQATAASGADTLERPGSTGRPLPCVEIEIIPRPGLPDGEIYLRSPTQMLGYFGIDESPIDSQGWLHTGDLGRVGADGHVWITGRCKDIIIRGGENIAPAAVEHALMTIPGVCEAVVFGVPHPDLGEEVMAIVVAGDEYTAGQFQEQLRTRVASYAIPSLWRVQTEPLPVNQTGKVDKPALIAQARAELGSR